MNFFQFIFDKGGKKIPWEKSSQKTAGATG